MVEKKISKKKTRNKFFKTKKIKTDEKEIINIKQKLITSNNICIIKFSFNFFFCRRENLTKSKGNLNFQLNFGGIIVKNLVVLFKFLSDLLNLIRTIIFSIVLSLIQCIN